MLSAGGPLDLHGPDPSRDPPADRSEAACGGIGHSPVVIEHDLFDLAGVGVGPEHPLQPITERVEEVVRGEIRIAVVEDHRSSHPIDGNSQGRLDAQLLGFMLG